MSHLRQSHVPFLRYTSSCIFNHPLIYQIYGVMMNISIRGKVHFWIYLLNQNSLTNKLGQMIDKRKDNIFLKSFEQFGDWSYVLDPFQFSNLLQFLNNYLCQVSSISFFLKEWIRENKKWWITTTKNWQISLYCHFIKIIVFSHYSNHNFLPIEPKTC